MKKIIHLSLLICLLIPARMFAQYSNASLNGTWVIVSQNYLYISFDGNGHVTQMGFQQDSLFPVGTYSVTSQGAVAGAVNLTQGLTWITGNMINDTTAMFYVDTVEGPYRMLYVSNTGALAGTWSGSVHDSSSQVTRNIQFTVNSSGAITSATGITLDSGNIFESRDTFAGYIITSDTSCLFQYLQIYGTYSGNTLSGSANLGLSNNGPGNSCSANGSVQFTKISTAVATITPDIDFSVYPNPFTDQVEITVKNPGSKMEAGLFDILGRKIYSGQYANTPNINLHLGDLSNGIYLLTLTSGGKTVTRRIIKD